MNIEQIQRFCSDEKGRPSIQKPYLCDVGGETWTIGTDGRRMLAVRGSLVEPPAEGPDVSHIFAQLDAATNLGTVDLPELSAFVGAPPEPIACTACKDGRVKCDECDGTGDIDCECDCGHEHEADCRACDGDGEVDCKACCSWRETVRPDCRVVIGNSVFDKAIVATGLADAERTSGTATLLQGGDVGMTALVGDGWRLVLMPLRDDPAFPRMTMPHFRLATETVA